MATTQGEIRIGALHQARLPDNRLTSSVSLSPDPELSKEREDLRWVPSMTLDGDLVMYLRAARSMAAFAGMCNGGSAEDGCIAASRDGTTMNAMDVLHDSGYEHGKALDALVKCPVPQAIEKQWSEEETKRFVKGLRQFGKNFYRIKKDLLPHKETPELVEFYYLWKKTPGANNSRPHRRRRQGSLRRNRNVRNTRTDTPKEEVGSGGSSRPSPSLKEQGEGSSASDDENSYDDSDSRENGGYRCQHCFTKNSRDWLHATSGPNQGALLCYACRSHYKQFGELPPVSRSDATYLFQPVRGESPDSSPARMRTRNKARETPTKEKTNKTKGSDALTPEPDVEKKLFMSNNTCDSLSGINSPPDKKKVKEVNRKRSFDQDGESDPKRKKENGMDSACASGSDQSDNESMQDEREEPSPLIDKDFKLNTSSPLPPALEREESMDTETDERRDEITNVTNTYEESSEGLENQTDKKDEDGRCYNNVPPFLEAQATQDYYNADSVNYTRPYDVVMSTDGVVIKQENICSPQDGMPPVLSEECEDMSTLPETQQFQCNSEFPTNNFSDTDTPIIGQIKIEPGTQEEDDDMEEKSLGQNEPNQDQISSYNQPISCERSPVPQSVLLPAYPPFNDLERNDRPSGNGINHAPYSTYYYPHMEKMGTPFSSLQAEPQDLKIKQEVMPMDQMPPTVDPLQSLKEVKVPGYASSSVSQPLLPTTSTSTVLDSRPSYNRSESNSPSLSGMATSEVKKESDFNANRPTSPFKMKPPTDGARSVSPRRTSSSRTPPYSHTGATSHSTSRSPILSPIANAPNIMSSSMLHPSQQPSPINRISPHLAHPHVYVPAMHPHPSLMQHSLFAVAAAHAAAMHHNPYSHHTYPGYPYSFPYGPYPIPQPIPPPRSMESQKREIESSTTLLTSHHSSSSSSITTRQVREDDVHSQEIHMSSSHHSSMHHHSDKQTISHSTSSSSSASVQHKVKRSSSPQHSSSSCHLSATLSQSTSSSSGHQSTHHHQHTHYQATGDPLSSLINVPMQLGGRGNGSGSVSSQNKPSILPVTSSVLPPHSALSLGGIPTAGSLEALRAHAHAAALHSPMQLQSSMHGMGGHGYLSPADMSMSGDVLKTEPALSSAEDGISGVPDEDDIPSPTHHIPKGPSPEPKIEDSECHRSQSAIFLRHWNRGDYNSCARTDLMFKPVPDSKLARKREERVRKQTEKEKEEREKVQARKMCTSDKSETKPPSRGPIETITSPYDRFTRGSPYADTPALRQLSEYARPHTGFSPVALQRSAASLGLPPQCIDPMLHYQLNMYGPTPRERLEMEHFEREKRERELRELREKDFSDRVKEEIMKTAGSRISNPIESHWIDFQRRFGALGPGGPSLHTFGLYPPPGTGAQPAGLTPLERERFERLGIPPNSSGNGPRGPSSIGIPCSSATMGPQGNPHAVAQLEAAERLALATDPMVTLQMAGISPEYHAHSHAHTHAHSHTHLHLHPGQQSQGSQPSPASDNPAFSLPGSAAGFSRQSILPPREAALALHHPSDLLARPYADQLAQQAAAHEHMQRQMLMERDRYPHPAILAQHEEYLRQQREIKVRALEEAARASRQ